MVIYTDWKLDYYIKSGPLEHANEPLFRITLYLSADNSRRLIGIEPVERSADSSSVKESTPSTKTESAAANGCRTLEFLCTRLELQDLVIKLRDAVKQVERSAEEFL